MALLHLKLLQHWTGLFYEKTSLQDLGLVIQLGHHGPLGPCPGPIQKDFVIVDLSGIPTIDIQFYACHNPPGGNESRIHLLSFCYFPSTTTGPQTALTYN